ncbi:MAG: GGDEF domain-containing phosphodiesterase [Angelakisella sp.]|nr:GGDEF domain-containing phosphodiesterase [Angelakisella sp.]
MVFGFVTYSNIKMRINEILKITEESTISMADTYATALLNSKEAHEIVENLLDEKILVASKAVLLLDDAVNDLSLTDLAERFQVDQISLYNAQGKILYSNEKEYVGWQAYEGHPVNNFIKSNQDNLVESIRQDTVNKKYYKFGYVKRSDSTFVQIGVLADNIHLFTSKFDTQRAIEEIITKENVEQAFFIDNNFKIVASSMPEYTDETIDDLSIKSHILKAEMGAQRSTVNGDEVFHACAPVFYNHKWLGTLCIFWTSDIINSEMRDIIVNGVWELGLIIFVIGAILYFAYRKNQSNIKIAYYDSLTGLPNAVYMDEYLSDAIKKSKQEKVAVLLLNCTNFKTLNTTYGFKYGDMILKQIAMNVKNVIRPNNMLFRFNHDRFILVVEGYKKQEELVDLAQGLIDIFKNPFDGGVKYEYVDAEIAILEVQNDNVTVDKILQDTALALNNLISSSHGHIIFFDKNMEVDLKRKDKIESTIRAVISGEDKKSFYLEFQPKLDTKTNRIKGFEALARMNIDTLGPVSPLEFVELAEKRLLIYELGKHIVKLACDFINVLKNEGFDLTVAVNLSVIQLLRNEFINDICLLIKESGIEPSMLEFEITESIFLDNFEIINRKFRDIKRLGASIALDDFGTGFSSFARLRDLEVDTVKIDQYFISKISALDNNDLLTADIISMSHKLGLNVVAEGVENNEQRKYLEKHKCDVLQGYLISKPLEYKKALDFLRLSSM